MSVTIDRTGVLVIDGVKVFPLGLSDPPPLQGLTPAGRAGLAELAGGGANFLRIGRDDWRLPDLDQQLAEIGQLLDAAHAHGLHCWLRLGETTNLPVEAGSANEQMLRRIVAAVRAHPALGAYKGVDEPHNPNRPHPVDPAGMVRGYRLLKALDPDHPLVVIHEPLSSAQSLRPYDAACDITGADIYPISYPPGIHAETANKDISLVGDVTAKLVQAAARKPVWMTLQIAWSGVIPSRAHPDVVPRFPTLLEERFMAYQAIVRGARGLTFFGGNLTQIMRPRDARLGWNWTFWDLVLHPLLSELTSASVHPALIAPASSAPVVADANDLELTTRDDGTFLYVIAVRRGTSTDRVTLSSLPARHDGTPLTTGQVLFEYEQDPLPPPVLPDHQKFRTVDVADRSFSDWFGPHDTHVYRFQL